MDVRIPSLIPSLPDYIETHRLGSRLENRSTRHEVKEPLFVGEETLPLKPERNRRFNFPPNRTRKLAEKHRMTDTFRPATENASAISRDLSLA
jgi:hypothetical protein